jgi:putative FmdB family regulatory protein
MPTYEYACRDCGHTFEIVQSMLDEPLTMCPECGGSLRKVFAPPAIAFKGSGFYTTDHGKKAKRSGEATGEGEGPAEKTVGKTPETSGEKSGERKKEPAGSKDPSTGASGEKPSKTTKEPAAS